jgi:hypothetical protein
VFPVHKALPLAARLQNIMFRIVYIVAFLSGLTSFVRPNSNSVILNYCVFKNPDTSVSGIKIRDEKSTVRILGKKIRLEGDSTHRFYSKNQDQILSMTVHPGDYYGQVSIFKVSYSGKYKSKYHQTNIESFKTEKGIRLGILKEEVVNKLGKCYTSSSRKGAEIITYRLESPQDSKTNLLERHNMPVYYSIYSFKKDKLAEFEFGFEYP